MNEMPLPLAVQMGLNRINQRRTIFKPNMASILADFQMSSSLGGVAAFLPEAGSNLKGYDVVKWSTPETPLLEITPNDLWTCAKEHYGLTATALALGMGGIPIKKVRLGYVVTPGSSKTTNLVSDFGVKFFPMAKLPNGSTAARVAKNTFGTIRVFGIIGRALPFVAMGLAVYDVISIGMCAYEERNSK